ncbi:hypothetical protein, partial [Serratia sp. CY81593]|uniref:hypothetical protein n=1 Tax=Serratia sp. CY81593 TaxID=3383685 RepID=UPI003FA069AB
ANVQQTVAKPSSMFLMLCAISPTPLAGDGRYPLSCIAPAKARLSGSGLKGGGYSRILAAVYFLTH